MEIQWPSVATLLTNLPHTSEYRDYLKEIIQTFLFRQIGAAFGGITQNPYQG